MAIEAHRTPVGTSPPTKLTTAAASAGYIGAYSACVRNRDATLSIFLGGPAVTAADGFELLAGEAQAFDLESGDDLYAITASGTASAHVIETGI